MTESIRVGLIYGSAREGRFCDTVANWVDHEIRECGFETETIDPAELDLPLRSRRNPNSAVRNLRRRLRVADAFVVVTPEYNHGYPAPLKALIDSANSEWQAKPVAFVSYGGISGGLRAVEQLRLVFAELHAVAIRDCVSFANPWNHFDACGRPKDDGAARAAMTRMVAHLRWWATHLRHARTRTPYDRIPA